MTALMSDYPDVVAITMTHAISIAISHPVAATSHSILAARPVTVMANNDFGLSKLQRLRQVGAHCCRPLRR
jgi:hypothetical protein